MYYKFIAKLSYEEGVTYEERGLTTGDNLYEAVLKIENFYNDGLVGLWIEPIQTPSDRYILLISDNVYSSL